MKEMTIVFVVGVLGLGLCVGGETPGSEEVNPMIRCGGSHRIRTCLDIVPENAATGGRATQSSGYADTGLAKRAIDRNRNSFYFGGSCSHTRPESNPWWRVDLLRLHNVTSVTITNRWDCCHERLDGGQIRVGISLDNDGNDNPLCAVISRIEKGKSVTYECGGMEGRYVNVFLPGEKKVLTLCEVEVNGSPVLSDENVALKGHATQSSTYNLLGKAENAIDGHLSYNYMEMSCTHTQKETDPWWRVDLLQVYEVNSVTVVNREDCCADRLDGAEIRIGNSLEQNGNNNSLCAVISHIGYGKSVTFECHKMEGRYVNVFLPGRDKYLTLCEVEVNGRSLLNGTEATALQPPHTDSQELGLMTKCGRGYKVLKCLDIVPVNAASGGKATQSSWFGSGSADKAIDRNRNPLYSAESCTHTRPESNPWWRVDLLRLHNVTSVTITNRWDCCHERLDGGQIRVGISLDNDGNDNPLCAVISHIGSGKSVTYECDGMEGRYVNVFLPGKEKVLTLCEVEVNGSPVPDGNVALKGNATQSSTYDFLGKAENAIDGHRNYWYLEMSCTHTQKETDPWWRVDLLQVYEVNSVTVVNREDCCADRLDGAEIRIGNSLEQNGNNNSLCAVISHIGKGKSVTFECHKMEGRYVNVFLPGRDKYLTLCEVEVNGRPLLNENLDKSPGLKSPDLKNVALRGKAAQSTESNGGRATNAIDGIRLKTCSRTEIQSDPWWRVDLLQVYNVSWVTVTNRKDCCSDMINGAEIRIGDALGKKGNDNPVCSVISSIPAGESQRFQCHGMEGRYVNILLPGKAKTLTLCEVEVYGTSLKAH